MQSSAFGIRCSVVCLAPFGASCFVRRSVRKGWAFRVLFDVVFGYCVLFGVFLGQACSVHRFVRPGLFRSTLHLAFVLRHGVFSSARHVLLLVSVLFSKTCFVWRFVRTR